MELVSIMIKRQSVEKNKKHVERLKKEGNFLPEKATDCVSEVRDATYRSFRGPDIVATFNGRVIGELQSISYSIGREHQPIRLLGRNQ